MSQAFIIRLWAGSDEGGNDARPEWEGRIQSLGEGQAATFTDWATLQQLLQEMLTSVQNGYKPNDAPNATPEESGNDRGAPRYPTPFQ